MSKLFFAFVFFCGLAVSNCEVEVSTKLTVLEAGSVIQGRNGKLRIVPKISTLPPDDGTSNWGDQVFKKRADEDVLLLRDLLIYPVTSTKDQVLKYSADFKNVNTITSVRIINVGRERAFGGEIDVYGDAVDLYLTIPAERDPRTLIEVYGYKS